MITRLAFIAAVISRRRITLVTSRNRRRLRHLWLRRLVFGKRV